jgi:tRNA threonylcarbamoyl adenosine modification protein YeaZ
VTVLALDTATPMSSVAVLGHGIRAERAELARNPGEVTVAQIDRLLTESRLARSDISQIVVGVGPGPYTSIRVGVAIAQGLGRALEVPVIGVCSLDAIAAATEISIPFAVATDARRREIYWATYDADRQRISGPTVGKPADVLVAHPDVPWAGDGLNRYLELVAQFGVQQLGPAFPSALALARIAVSAQQDGERGPTELAALSEHGAESGGGIDPRQRLFPPYPLYLRRPDAKEPVKASSRG